MRRIDEEFTKHPLKAKQGLSVQLSQRCHNGKICVNIQMAKRSHSNVYKVSIVIEKDENGYYAYSPELGGCQTQGDSLEEIIANMKEAIELYIETLTEPAFGFSEAKAAIGYTSGPKQESLFHSIREKHCIQKSSNKSIRL